MRIKKFNKIFIFIFIIFIFASFYIPSKSYGEKSDTILVLEASKLPASFQKFKELKEKEGYNVIVLNINSLTGDKSESLRSYLRDNMEKMNIKYLLIVGSDKVFPMKRFFPRGNNVHDQFDSDFDETPSDIYFVDPFEDFDKDKDGIFGEYPDDDIKIDTHIYVGRVPFDSQNALDSYFSKLVEFEKLPFNKKNYGLFIGAYLSFKGETWYDRVLENEDGGEFMEILINDFILKNGITPIRVYERDGTLPSFYFSDYSLSEKVISDLLKNKIFGFINLNAHGSPYGVAGYVWEDRDKNFIFSKDESKFYSLMTISDIPYDFLGGVLFASSCLTAYPESEINLAREYLSKGGSVYIGATRISWGPTYWRDLNDGGLLTINYLFVKNFIDEKMRVGEAFWKSIETYQRDYFDKDKEDPIDAAQMNMYTFNLFGDPTLTLYLEENSFSISTDRYTREEFEDDLIFVNAKILKGEKFNKEVNFNDLRYENGGFVVENKGEKFSLKDFNFEIRLKKLKEENIVYLYKYENENKIFLRVLKNGGRLYLRFSSNIKPLKSNYYDSYRNIAIFDLKNHDEIVFVKNDDEKYFINSPYQNVLILNDNFYDYNGDHFINFIDFYIFSKHFGENSKSLNYNKIFDLDYNLEIDGKDLILFSKNYGEVIKEEN